MPTTCVPHTGAWRCSTERCPCRSLWCRYGWRGAAARCNTKELCELHDKGLKPTEGRLSYHTITLENWNFDNSLSWNVAREWLRKENVSLVEEILERWVKTQKEPKK